MTFKVAQIEVVEAVELRHDSVAILQEYVGQSVSQDVLEVAFLNISRRIVAVETAVHRGEMRLAGKNAQALALVAEQLGLVVLAKVARDVADVTQQADLVALQAVIGRLARIGQASLFAIAENPEIAH